ncbi:hypothetical protein ACSVC9_10475 [Clostridium sp. LBM24168]
MRFLLVFILMFLCYLADSYYGKPKGLNRSTAPYFIVGIVFYLTSILFDMGDDMIKVLLKSTGLFG